MKNKQFAVIASITFFVGMVWLIADIIFNTKASIPISDKLQTLMEPVNPTFNARVLEIIERQTLDRSSITVTDAIPSPAPSLETPVPSSIPEPTPNQTRQSSPSGELNL
jgi:hypothetical protein